MNTEPTDAADITPDSALALLKETDLSPETLAALSKNSALMKQRKVKLALVLHPKTPRHITVPLLRHLFTFDLMRVALTPTIHGDIKVAAEGSLIHRLEKLSLGEKLSLARRASSRVAAALLHDPEPKVVDTALDNARLTEQTVVKELMKRDCGPHLLRAIRAHPSWSLRTDIRAAIESRQPASPKSNSVET